MKRQGFVLIISVLTLTTLLMVGSYILAVANSENNISNAQSLATKNYYLAEAGINEMIWKIQNDSSTRDAFLNGTLNSGHNISKSNVFGDVNASYIVAAINTVAAEAWITATSTYQIGDNVSRRVVKTYITRPTGSDNEWDYGTFAGGRGSQQNGNFRFKGSGVVMNVTGGKLHANQEFKIQGVELIVNNGSVGSANVINVVSGGTLTLNNSYQDVPTSTVEMLIIDFDSTNSNSWKNRADVTYTQNNFKNLASGTILNGIIYVSGDAEIKNKNLTINGVLVAEEDIIIDLDNNTFTLNADAEDGGGLLAKGDIAMEAEDSTISAQGLIYASDDLDIISTNSNFTIEGSLTGFDAEVSASGNAIILNYTPEYFQAVIDSVNNPEAPIIQIDHWEEQY